MRSPRHPPMQPQPRYGSWHAAVKNVELAHAVQIVGKIMSFGKRRPAAGKQRGGTARDDLLQGTRHAH